MSTQTADKSKLDNLLDAPLVKTVAVDIPPGTYPATLIGFSDVRLIKDGFAKPGRPDMKQVFDMDFAIRVKDGSIETISHMVNVAEGGMTNQKSNLYKALKLMGGPPGKKLFDDDGNYVSGTTLRSFIGSNAILNVGKNKKDFPSVESLGAPAEGPKYPEKEEIEKALAASDGVPF